MKLLLQHGFSRHPKVLRLASHLGVTRAVAVGHLVLMWEWVLGYRVDGRLSGLSDREVAAAAGWRGKPDRLLSGLLTVGLVDQTDDGLQLHDWLEHQGKFLEDRARDAERKRAARVRRTSGGRPPDVHPPLTLPFPSLPFPDDDGSELPQSGSPHPDPARNGVAKKPVEVPPDLQDLKLYREDLRLCHHWPDLLHGWREAYPGVDLLGEVKKAHAWELSNPKRQKKDRMKFLGNWLSRAQDSSRGGGAHGGLYSMEDPGDRAVAALEKYHEEQREKGLR